MTDEDRLTALTSKAVRALESRAWLNHDEAQELVSFALEGAQEQALNVIAGSTTVASSQLASRAERLYYVCKSAKRWLTQREVEVLFRLTPAAARSTMVAAQAAYEADLVEFLISDMRQRVQLKPVGTGTRPLVRVRCGTPSVLNVLMNEIHRLGWGNEFDEGPGRNELTLPEKVKINGNQTTFFDAFGVPKPADWPAR